MQLENEMESLMIQNQILLIKCPFCNYCVMLIPRNTASQKLTLSQRQKNAHSKYNVILYKQSECPNNAEGEKTFLGEP